METIIILNHNPKAIQAQSYFAINLATCLVNKHHKVLMFSTILSPKYFNEIKTDIDINKDVKSIPPFKFYQYQKNLDILMFGTDTNQNVKVNNVDEVLRLLKRQLKLIENKYDYIVVDYKNQWSNLDDFFIRNTKISLINFLEFTKNTKFTMLNNLNHFKTQYNINTFKYPFAISNYDGFDKECLQIYNSLETQYQVKQLFYFNESFSQPVNFIKYKPWSKNSIILETLIDKFINHM